MIARLNDFWMARTPRERVMLMAMGAALAAFAVWLLVLRPAAGWADEAAGRRREAEARLAAVSTAPTAPSRPADLEATLRATAAAQGLEPVLAMSEEGGLGFRLTAADGSPVLRWLAAVKAAAGVEPRRLSMLAEDGRLTVDGAF